MKFVVSSGLSAFPLKIGFWDLIIFLSIISPSLLWIIISKFSLYFACQFPKLQTIFLDWKLHLGSRLIGETFVGNLSWNCTFLISWIKELFRNLYIIFNSDWFSGIDLTIFFALGSGILISFNSTSLKLIQIFAKIGNKIIEKTKRTAG